MVWVPFGSECKSDIVQFIEQGIRGLVIHAERHARIVVVGAHNGLRQQTIGGAGGHHAIDALNASVSVSEGHDAGKRFVVIGQETRSDALAVARVVATGVECGLDDGLHCEFLSGCLTVKPGILVMFDCLSSTQFGCFF